MPVVRPGVIVDHAIVKGTLEAVFAFMGDFSNSVKWDPGVKSSVRDQQGPIEVGSTFSLVTVFKGSESQMTYKISKWVPPVEGAPPPRTAEVELLGDGKIISAVDTMKLTEDTEAGTVRIDYTADLSLKSWRKPFILLIGSALNTLGTDAMQGIVNYYTHGDKNGPAKSDAAAAGASSSVDERHS